MPVITCPHCRQNLQLAAEHLGKRVQCPTCNQMFPTTRDDGAAPAPPPPPPPPRENRGDLERRYVDEPLARRDDDYDRPPPRRYDDDDYDRPRRRRYDDDDYERSPRYRGYDDDYDYRSRRREPHRGSMILVLGILSFVVCPILGPIAWVMGNNDLNAMSEGHMDPSGRGETNAGRIVGMVSTILSIIVLACYCVIFAIIIAASRPR